MSCHSHTEGGGPLSTCEGTQVLGEATGQQSSWATLRSRQSFSWGPPSWVSRDQHNLLVLHPSPREWLPAARGVSCPQAPREGPYDALVSQGPRRQRGERQEHRHHTRRSRISLEHLRRFYPMVKLGHSVVLRFTFADPTKTQGECLGWKKT